MADTLGGTLRSVLGYVVQNTPVGGTLRNIQGYAAQSVPALQKPIGGNTSLYTFINIASTFKWTTTNSALGSPVSDDSVAGVNTSIVLTARPVSGYKGSLVLRYRRRDLLDAFQSQQAVIQSPSADTSVHALLGTINTAYGYELTTSDLEDTAVLAGATSLTLVVASGSYMFVPGTQITLALVTG